MMQVLKGVDLTSKKWIAGLFLLLFVIRLYHLDGPLVDRHSWNQISTAATIKYMTMDWKYLLYPTVDVYVAPGYESRVYAQEFPLYHIPATLLNQWTGHLEASARIVTIAFGMLGLWGWFLLSRKTAGDTVAWWTTLFWGFSPLNWFYQRAVMGDTSMVTGMIWGLYFFYLWLEQQQKKYLFYALLWTMATGLFKPFGLVIGVSYLALIVLRKNYWCFRRWEIYVVALLAWLPTLLWIAHALTLESGISEFADVNNMNQIRHPELLLQWEFYSTLIGPRLLDSLLTPWIGIFFIGSLFSLRVTAIRYHIPIAWMSGCLMYLVIVQHGNFQHEYYQLPFGPGLCLLAGLGFEQFLGKNMKYPMVQTWFARLMIVLFILHATAYFYRFSRYDEGSYATGRKIAELNDTPEARVLAWDIGSNKWNQMIYYSGLTGWCQNRELTPELLELYRQHGARWLGVNMLKETHYPTFRPLLEKIETAYPLVWKNDQYPDRYQRKTMSLIFDLQPDAGLP
ncbi:MAG: glycosyltransferase family 39 protein [SAR324 cluster bacterium]|nr:glycosyltransferase family 39 protein [SAR324 cluster bacterium]